MALASIWRNRIEAGTKKLANCPKDIKNDVISLIQDDVRTNKFSEDQLYSLVLQKMLEVYEYDTIMDGVK